MNALRERFSFAFNLKRQKQALEELEKLKLHNKTLELLYDNVRIFRHDFFNIMQSIDGYIKTNDMASLEKYYREIKKECDGLNNLSFLNPDFIDEPAIYNLIGAKYYKAEEANISLDMHFFLKISSLKISPYTLSRILGILLDNAIEAASVSPEKKINFEIVPAPCYNSFKQKSLVIIENSYINKDVDLNKIREKGFTSKLSDTCSHGLGLFEVNKLLRRHKNLNLHTTKNNDYFRQTLEIY